MDLYVYAYDNGILKSKMIASISPNRRNYVKQIHSSMEGLQTKWTKVGGYESNQIFNLNSGDYQVIRSKFGKILSGYEMNLKPGRTFAQGFAGKLEKTAMELGSIGGGKERPVLTQVVELMFNIAKKIR